VKPVVSEPACAAPMAPASTPSGDMGGSGGGQSSGQ
jgi:hypothetical protein